MVMVTEFDLRQALVDRGCRVTAQRLLIYEALATTESHPTAEELYAALKDRLPSMSPATVYNTLELLVEMGLATFSATAGVRRYDGDIEPHAHLVCTRCGAISDIPVPGLDGATAGLMKQKGFILRHQKHEYVGLCGSCSKENTLN